MLQLGCNEGVFEESERWARCLLYEEKLVRMTKFNEERRGRKSNEQGKRRERTKEKRKRKKKERKQKS